MFSHLAFLEQVDAVAAGLPDVLVRRPSSRRLQFARWAWSVFTPQGSF